MSTRAELARGERESTGNRASILSQMRGIDPNQDVPLKWLMKSNVQKAYNPGFINESDLKHETWGNTTERRREIADKALSTVLGGNKSMETHVHRPKNTLSYRERAIMFEKELMETESHHEPECSFHAPDESLWFSAEDYYHPQMHNTTRAALTGSSVYRSLIFAAENMKIMKKDTDWDESEFTTWLHSVVHLPNAVLRDVKDKYISLVYRLDNGGRFYVMWVLPASPRHKGRYAKMGALMFFTCSCTRLKE